MNKKISDLTIPEFTSLIRRIVKKELNNYDPDDGLIVKKEVANLLNKSAKTRRAGKQKTIPFSKVLLNELPRPLGRG
jgi:hypothetical protein